MAHNENLANRIRQALKDLDLVTEKKMFGKIAFMVNDKMCITVGANSIMCRIDPGLHAEAIKRDGCRSLIMKGKEYKGYVYVDEAHLQTKVDFDHWMALALAFNKKAKASKKQK